MSFYKVRINGLPTVIRTEATYLELLEFYGDDLLGKCDMHGLAEELESTDYSSQIKSLGSFNRSVPTSEGGWVAPMYLQRILARLKEAQSPTVDEWLKQQNNIFKAGDRFVSMTRHGPGEFSMMSVPVKALPVLSRVKGVAFRNSVIKTNTVVSKAAGAQVLFSLKLHEHRDRMLDTIKDFSDVRKLAFYEQYETARAFARTRIEEIMPGGLSAEVLIDQAEPTCTAFLVKAAPGQDYVRHFAIRFKNGNWIIEE